MKRIMIGITTAETVCNETMESIYNMDIPKDVETDLKIIHSYQVDKGRNDLALIAMNGKYDYIFFVDSDVILPKFALTKLYEANVDVINGTYPRKQLVTLTSPNPFTTLYRHSDRNRTIYCPYFMPQSELPLEGVVPVDCAGLGCTLIKMDLFKTLPYPWFVYVNEKSAEKDGPYCIGEDMFFYRSCIRKGIQPYAEGSVRCGHVGKFIYRLKEQQK